MTWVCICLLNGKVHRSSAQYWHEARKEASIAFSCDPADVQPVKLKEPPSGVKGIEMSKNSKKKWPDTITAYGHRWCTVGQHKYNAVYMWKAWRLNVWYDTHGLKPIYHADVHCDDPGSLAGADTVEGAIAGLQEGSQLRFKSGYEVPADGIRE